VAVSPLAWSGSTQPGRIGARAVEDQRDVAGVDRPGPVQGLGDVPPVHDQLAEQDPEREVGGHGLAAVEAERRRRRLVALDLVADGGEVAAEPRGQLLCAAAAERADLGVVQLGQPAGSGTQVPRRSGPAAKRGATVTTWAAASRTVRSGEWGTLRSGSAAVAMRAAKRSPTCSIAGRTRSR
jgi:hypothetical protein